MENPRFRPTTPEIAVPFVQAARVVGPAPVGIEIEIDPNAEPVELPHEFVIRDFAAADLCDPTVVYELIPVLGNPCDEATMHLLQSAKQLCDLGALRDVQCAARYVIGTDPYNDPWAPLLERADSKAAEVGYGRMSWFQTSKADPADRNLALVLNTYLAQMPIVVPFDIERVVTSAPAALCAQLFNILVKEPTIRLCANEPCRSPFTSRGPSEPGSYRRSGVKYCSVACAKSKAERERRRRKAAEKRNRSIAATPNSTTDTSRS